MVALLTLVAALAGVLTTAANRWGAGEPGPCRDTITAAAASCIAPQSPLWALVVGAALPAAAVLAMAALSVRQFRG